MRIGLVADIPDQLVLGRVEHGMKRNGEFDHAQTRAEVAASDRNRIDGFGPKLVCDLFQLGPRAALQVGWRC